MKSLQIFLAFNVSFCGDLVFLKSSQANQNSMFSSQNSDFRKARKAARPSRERKKKTQHELTISGILNLPTGRISFQQSILLQFWFFQGYHSNKNFFHIYVCKQINALTAWQASLRVSDFLGKQKMNAISSPCVPFCDACIYVKKNPSLDGICCVNLYTGANIYACTTNLWNVFCNGKDDSSSKSKW